MVWGVGKVVWAVQKVREGGLGGGEGEGRWSGGDGEVVKVVGGRDGM